MTLRPYIALLAATLLTAGVAAAQPGAKKDDGPDFKEIRDYRLNMDVAQKFVRAATAMRDDPAARKCLESNPPGKAPTLDAGEKLLKACPPAVAAVNTAGLKPREFLIVTGSLFPDLMAVSMKKGGAIKEYPSSISPENAAFVEQNADKLAALLAPLMNSK
jgi:hypothetical protein